MGGAPSVVVTPGDAARQLREKYEQLKAEGVGGVGVGDCEGEGPMVAEVEVVPEGDGEVVGVSVGEPEQCTYEAAFKTPAACDAAAAAELTLSLEDESGAEL